MESVHKRIIEVFRFLVASMPSEDHLPSNAQQMIEQCEALGREDLADQIKLQWRKVLKKYPATRVNWGSVIKIGCLSVKKNVFGGKEYASWISEQHELSSEQKKEASKIDTVIKPPKEIPTIAVPKDNETIEDWHIFYDETKLRISEIRKALSDINGFISFLEKQISGLKRKLSEYGPEGSKKVLNKGKPDKRYITRIPKWEVQLDAYTEQLNVIKTNFKEADMGFKDAEKKYNSIPITTVSFEKLAQQKLDKVLMFVLDTEDLEQQEKFLSKFNFSLQKLAKKATGSYEVTSDFWDGFFKAVTDLIANLKAGWSRVLKWVKGLNKSVQDFDALASIRYDVSSMD